ncbi:Glutathione S-transferase domain protein [mine drainage metagenome]|uniref:Glutathione S-transferase domain protein n=1 Tax=mine drainage metagenome TaxID=410659 RepID=T1BA78_9ZZZZ
MRKILLDTIVQGVELFQLKPFFLSDEFSLVDATLAPVLWRLPYYQIELPPKAQPIVRYQSRIFARPAFARALSDAERAMHR